MKITTKRIIWFSVLWILLAAVSFAGYKYYQFSHSNNLEKLAILDSMSKKTASVVWLFDKDTSKEITKNTKILETVRTLISEYDKQEYNAVTGTKNFLQENEQSIDYLFEDLDTVLTTLSWSNIIDTSQYSWFTVFLQDWLSLKSEVLDLLWKNSEKRYAVVFQNSNELRPWGWFGWSTLLLTFKWWEFSYRMIDTYRVCLRSPDPQIRVDYNTEPLEWDDWLTQIYWSKTVWYSWNTKVWLTKYDGKYFVDWYQYCQRQRLDWVIFLQSQLIKELIPEIWGQMNEWQFVNAATDILKAKEKKDWKNTIKEKKQLYLNSVNAILARSRDAIVARLIQNFSVILQKWYVSVYLKDYQNNNVTIFLKKHWLVKHLWTWDIGLMDANYAFNKVDSFLHKTVTLTDVASWTIVYANTWATYTNILHAQSLMKQWRTYSLDIQYSLSIPESYRTYIAKLEQKYGIKLTEREQHILAVWKTDKFHAQYAQYAPVVNHYWFVMLWKDIEILWIEKRWELGVKDPPIKWMKNLAIVKLPEWNQILYSYMFLNDSDTGWLTVLLKKK